MNKTSIFKSLQLKIQELGDFAFSKEGSAVAAMNAVSKMSISDQGLFSAFYKKIDNARYIPSK